MNCWLIDKYTESVVYVSHLEHIIVTYSVTCQWDSIPDPFSPYPITKRKKWFGNMTLRTTIASVFALL